MPFILSILLGIDVAILIARSFAYASDDDPGQCWAEPGYSWQACCNPFWRGGNPICWDAHSTFTFSRCCVERENRLFDSQGLLRVSMPRPALASVTSELDGLRASVSNAAYRGGADAHRHHFVKNLRKYAGYTGALPQLIQIIAFLSSRDVGQRLKRRILEDASHSNGNGTSVVVEVPVRVLDIGAGWFESNPGDQMMALRSLRSWGGCVSSVPNWDGPDWLRIEQHAEFYAFEPNPKTFAALDGYLDFMLKDEERPCLHLVQAAVSDISGTMKLMGKDNNASLATHLVEQTKLAPGVDVRVVTVDSFASELGIDFFDFVKIDCEGMDWQVVKGMQNLLREHRVEVVALEISEKMSPSTWRLALGEEDPPDNIRQLSSPTLLEITAWFDELGYDGFLVGMLVLTPITGAWWRDDYEICSDPAKNFGRDKDGFAQCWMDVIFVSRRSSLLPVLINNHGPIDDTIRNYLCIVVPRCREKFFPGSLTGGRLS